MTSAIVPVWMCQIVSWVLSPDVVVLLPPLWVESVVVSPELPHAARPNTIVIARNAAANLFFINFFLLFFCLLHFAVSAEKLFVLLPEKFTSKPNEESRALSAFG
jgi:hypothetical protein